LSENIQSKNSTIFAFHITLILIEGNLNLIVIYFITSNMDESELFPFIRNAVIHVLLI